MLSGRRARNREELGRMLSRQYGYAYVGTGDILRSMLRPSWENPALDPPRSLYDAATQHELDNILRSNGPPENLARTSRREIRAISRWMEEVTLGMWVLREVEEAIRRQDPPTGAVVNSIRTTEQAGAIRDHYGVPVLQIHLTERCPRGWEPPVTADGRAERDLRRIADLVIPVGSAAGWEIEPPNIMKLLEQAASVALPSYIPPPAPRLPTRI